MNYNILIFSSVTYALKAQGVLSREGINTRLEKLRKEQSLKGCGYGLRIDKRFLKESVRLLKDEKIKIVDTIPYESR